MASQRERREYKRIALRQQKQKQKKWRQRQILKREIDKNKEREK